MARSRKQRPESLLAIALAPFAGALVTTRSKMMIKVIGGSLAANTNPQYWEWQRGHPLLFCGGGVRDPVSRRSVSGLAEGDHSHGLWLGLPVSSHPAGPPV